MKLMKVAKFETTTVIETGDPFFGRIRPTSCIPLDDFFVTLTRSVLNTTVTFISFIVLGR